jgi:hypothetical protein
MTQQYHKGMSYGAFLKMIEEQRNPPVDPAPPLDLECAHPFDWVERQVKGKRSDQGLVIVVSYKCGACDAVLAEDRKLLRSKKTGPRINADAPWPGVEFPPLGN